MTLGSVVVAVVLVAIVTAIIVNMVRKHRAGKPVGCNCSSTGCAGCSGGCATENMVHSLSKVPPASKNK